MRILVCDDDATLLELLDRFLVKTYGAEIRRAADGKAALAEAEGFAPDVIVLDYMMPKMNGIQVLEALKKLKGSQGRPKVLVYSAFNVKSQAQAAGADGFLQKPGTVDQLKRAIDQVLQRP